MAVAGLDGANKCIAADVSDWLQVLETIRRWRDLLVHADAVTTIVADATTPRPARGVIQAKVLKHHIVGQKLYTNIVGKNYAHVEGWQFAGGLLGTYPRVISVENLSNGNEIKWKADVEIINIKTGVAISRGFAICSNKKSKKRSFDEYAVLSMAQPRQFSGEESG